MIHFFLQQKSNNKDLSLKREKVKIVLHKATTSKMSSSDLRELFEACKTGELTRVKKLLTPQNVNEIGELKLKSVRQGPRHSRSK